MTFFLTFLILAAVCKVFMDRASEGMLPWNPSFWNKAYSWTRKWKNGDPKQGERFFLSSTALVFLTDGWHLAQFAFLKFMVLAMLTYEPMTKWPVADFVIVTVVFTGSFELLYRKVKKK